VKLAEEAGLNIGFAVGLWRCRDRETVDTAT